MIYRTPSNNAPGILIETHETPFSGLIKRRTKSDMKQMKVIT